VHVPELYEALAGTPNVPVTNVFLRLLLLGTSAVRSGFTRSIGFLTGNMQRDQMTAMVQSRYGYKPSDFFTGLFHALAQDDTYQLFLHSKGASSGLVGTYSDHLERTVRDIGKTKLRRAV